MSWGKKRIPDFDHTYCVQVLNITTSQNSIAENGNRLNSLYWYKAIVRCTHLVARILQHGCKFSSWLKVNKISNQTVHHQSATKLDSMLQDIKKKHKPVKLKILSAFLILRKNKNTNIFNHISTDWLIISLLNTVKEKKITAWKTECEDKRVAWLAYANHNYSIELVRYFTVLIVWRAKKFKILLRS